MAGQFLDFTGLAKFKDNLVNLFNTGLSNKQDKGNYVTKEDLLSGGYLEAVKYGSERDRSSSDPTYGLDSIDVSNVMDIIDTGSLRNRDPSKPSYGL